MTSPAPCPKQRILVVDDEPQIGTIFGLRLRLAGYDVESTVSGAAAIELIREQKFDAVLLDLVMPGVTGADVLEKVRQFSDVPVIIFTARADIFETVKSLGASDYIAKPIDPALLVAKVRAVLGGDHDAAAVSP